MKPTTLGKLGAEMPVGILGSDRKLNKSFKLRPFRLKEEKELAAMKEKGGMNLGKYVSHVLAVMCDEIGGEKLGELKLEQRLLKISGMWMCDVLYIYTYLRVEALGDSLKANIPCNRCKEPFPFTADLQTLDVRTVDDPKELLQNVELRNGFPYQGQDRKKITLQPVRWSVFESRSTKDLGALQASVIQSSICGIDGVPDEQFSPVPDKALDELSKRDMVSIEKAINDRTPGPLMAISAECPTCSSKWTMPIDWGYDSFFSHSSL